MIRARLDEFDVPAEGPVRRLRAEPFDYDDPGSIVQRIYAEPVTAPADANPYEGFLEPEDRGLAVLSPLGEVEYLEDLVRPGRIVVFAGEEGSGKSYAMTELGIRVAAAGGSFAGTWPVLQQGPVLIVSEMHADDDYNREATVLASLGLERSALTGRYYRLPLMTAAGGRPALMSEHWREWTTDWLGASKALLLVVDTATGATQVDPWGTAIQNVYAGLRGMLAWYPELAIVLLLHLKKPQGHGERRLSDVLGEWGRWCDVVILMENDGNGLSRSRLTVRKRVRRERRIVATKTGGLLVDPVDLDEAKGTRVPLETVLASIVASPGILFADLGRTLGVSKDTAGNYVRALEKAGSVVTLPAGKRGALAVYPADGTAEPPKSAECAPFGGRSAVEATENRTDRRTPNPYIGSAVRSSVVTAFPESVA